MKENHCADQRKALFGIVFRFAVGPCVYGKMSYLLQGVFFLKEIKGIASLNIILMY